jgi:peptide/nickel transport system substrate-binding protein
MNPQRKIRAGRNGLSRRQLIAGLGASGVAGLAGCSNLRGGSGDDSDGNGDGDGDALRISIITDPGSPMNPYITNNARWDWLIDLVHDKLLFPSPFAGPEPGLATDVQQVDDLTWEATIRDGVEWHDGEAFTAEDVAFSLQYYRDGPHSRNAHHANQIPSFETVEQLDEKTVSVETSYPTPTLAEITFADMPVLPEHIFADVEDPTKYQELAVGTGPYEIVEYNEGENLRFEATGEWFYGDTIVDTIVAEVVPDSSVTFTALKTGEIDSTVRPVPPETLGRFRSDDAIDVVEATQLQGVELRLNFSKLPFRNHDFRRAFSRAIDIQSIVDVVMLGEAIPGTKGFPHPRSPWTAPDLEIPYRPQAARQALDELGYEDSDGDGVRESPDGEPLEFELTAPSNEPQYIRAGELVADQLGNFGIDVTVKTTDPGTVRSFYGRLDAYEMYISSSNFHLSGDPDQFIMNHRGGPNLLWNINPSQGLLGDHDADPEDLRYPAFEELQQQYFEASTKEEMLEVYHEMNRLHNRQPVAIPLWYPLDHLAYRPDAYDKWAESPGYGIAHKWSFIETEDRGNAVTTEFY